MVSAIIVCDPPSRMHAVGLFIQTDNENAGWTLAVSAIKLPNLWARPIMNCSFNIWFRIWLSNAIRLSSFQGRFGWQTLATKLLASEVGFRASLQAHFNIFNLCSVGSFSPIIFRHRHPRRKMRKHRRTILEDRSSHSNRVREFCFADSRT